MRSVLQLRPHKVVLLLAKEALTSSTKSSRIATKSVCVSWEKKRRQWRMMSTTTKTSNGETADEEEVILQYVVLRRDLIDSWPFGSVVTQGCHASVGAIWENKDDPVTLSYCSHLNSMHKVTVEVKGETQLVNLSEKLKANGILHKLWIEQPENYPTCLATKPYPKSSIYPFFKKLRLCK